MKYLITIILLGAGLYVSVAGYEGAKTLQEDSVKVAATPRQYEYHDKIFRDEQELFAFIHQEQTRRWFGWIFTLPTRLVLLVGAMAAGLFGGALRIMMLLPRDSSMPYSQVFAEPIVGLSIGFLLFFFSLAVPAVFITGSNPVRPESVLLFCLCGGVFSERAYKWLEAQVGRLIFNIKRDGESKRAGTESGGDAEQS